MSYSIYLYSFTLASYGVWDSRITFIWQSFYYNGNRTTSRSGGHTETGRTSLPELPCGLRRVCSRGSAWPGPRSRSPGTLQAPSTIFFLQGCIREATKKNPPLMVGPLRGGRGVKAGPLRKKELFLKLFFYLLPFKNKNYITLDNLSKYGNITLMFAGRYFYILVTIFSKK